MRPLLTSALRADGAAALPGLAGIFAILFAPALADVFAAGLLVLLVFSAAAFAAARDVDFVIRLLLAMVLSLRVLDARLAHVVEAQQLL
jgi:hypothetical protein